ncbi:prepilin peptidase [Alkaliphilus sp. B6464]|uniref:prepilin peptidase n=1 Tax=Alkaliphilus sp. B6464 TaxID=2731219 RepID=UPI001BA84314|nr:A24 family peptidase [Alkaliphilus sp. B6464]QUH22021.1 prepilin peptidase [Alkaliphilus sp. B6464]
MNFILVITMMILAVINDFKTRQIKNFIPLIFVIIGTIYSVVNNPLNLVYSFATSILLFIVLFYIPRKFNINEFLGAGDIKIYMAITFLMGWNFTLYTFVYSIFIGTIFLILLNFKRLKSILYNAFFFFTFKGKWEIEEKQEQTNIFTPYILIGVLMAYYIKAQWIF